MLLFPYNDYVFDTHTDFQNEFISTVKNKSIEDGIAFLERERGKVERSYPRELEFKWDERGEATLYLSKSPDFKEAREIRCEGGKCTLTNFEIGEDYYWRVDDSEIRHFSTLGDFPRFIEIDGLLNVRDIGGVNIKQGILYRGSELERCYHITEKGKRTFIHELGIKSELDLRLEMPEVQICSAGPEVKIAKLGYRPYDEVFLDEHRAGIVKIMEFLADENNYPVYFNCMGGADRTGMIAIYLRALAGEDEEAIHLDYEITGLSLYAAGIREGVTGFRTRHAPYYARFIEEMRSYAPSGSLNDAIEAFLIECGVKPEIIEKIRRIIKK